MAAQRDDAVAVTFAGSGDAFGSGGRYQACIHVQAPDGGAVLLDCGATSMTALRSLDIDPGGIAAVVISHLHGDHFGGLPFLILDAQFAKRTQPLWVVGPVGLAHRLTEAMETFFPGSGSVRRTFTVHTVELHPGQEATVAGAGVSAWEVSHPSGAPPLALRLEIGGARIAYTGDTAWTDAIPRAAAGAHLLIAEAYSFDKPIPHHLTHAALAEHRAELDCERVVLTHCSAEMLARAAESRFDIAHDGLRLRVG